MQESSRAFQAKVIVCAARAGSNVYSDEDVHLTGNCLDYRHLHKGIQSEE